MGPFKVRQAARADKREPRRRTQTDRGAVYVGEAAGNAARAPLKHVRLSADRQ